MAEEDSDRMKYDSNRKRGKRQRLRETEKREGRKRVKERKGGGWNSK